MVIRNCRPATGRHSQQEYDAANTFGSGVDSDISTYLNGVQQQQQGLASALSTAEANEYNLPQNQPVAPDVANYDSTSTAMYGEPIYKDANGNLYDANGNPYTPKS